MSLAGSRRVMVSSVGVFLIIWVIQILVCCDCKVGAIRMLPAHERAREDINGSMVETKRKDELFSKFFSGKAFDFTNPNGNGFQESKRKVPSCPDPLHN